MAEAVGVVVVQRPINGPLPIEYTIPKRFAVSKFRSVQGKDDLLSFLGSRRELPLAQSIVLKQRFVPEFSVIPEAEDETL